MLFEITLNPSQFKCSCIWTFTYLLKSNLATIQQNSKHDLFFAWVKRKNDVIYTLVLIVILIVLVNSDLKECVWENFMPSSFPPMLEPSSIAGDWCSSWPWPDGRLLTRLQPLFSWQNIRTAKRSRRSISVQLNKLQRRIWPRKPVYCTSQSSESPDLCLLVAE